MAYNSRHKKQSRPIAPLDHGDDYVYPTKKVREVKTRNRRNDVNEIKAGLLDHENLGSFDHQDDEQTDHDIDQDIMDEYNEMIEEFNTSDDGDIDNSIYDNIDEQEQEQNEYDFYSGYHNYNHDDY